MIPENKQLAVKKALQTAFATDEFGSIQQITIGLSSALIFKIVVHETPYLLRVIMRDDTMADPTYYFNCMKTAEGASLGPRIYYLNNEDRISITDFIIAKPFSIDVARKQIPQLLKQLHALSKFPFRINYFNAMEGFAEKFLASNILPENETKDVFEQYARIAKVYPKSDVENWVSCHNDLKPENILFDGTRPWLVDWEGAFLNDRYLDLSIVANFVVKNEQDEIEYLQEYFGNALDEYKRAQFFVMQQMLHVYYFFFFMMAAAKGKYIDLNSVQKYDYSEYNDRLWSGEIDLANDNAKMEYSLVHKEIFLQNVNTRRLEDSLHLLSALHAHA